jgi:hypothetical protein
VRHDLPEVRRGDVPDPAARGLLAVPLGLALVAVVSYAELIARREEALLASPAGVEAAEMAPHLFGFQADATAWALRRGRAAIFAATGLGKTLMELEWARQVGGTVLLLAPLAVGKQIVREAERFGIDNARTVADPADVREGINVTNYERLHRFWPDGLDGLVLDESSILKAFDGKTRQALTEFGLQVPMRLCATATPAPNDYEELGQHAEFLGVLTAREMLALYFTQDGNTTTKWRLKGHARQPFWRWVASWALAISSPADLGHHEEAERFRLPPLRVEPVVVAAADPHATGTLFAGEAQTLQERREARRRTLDERVAATAALVAAEPDEQWLLWCDLNAESEALTKAILGAVEVRGSDTPEHKEASLLGFADGAVRVLVTKPSIAGFGMNWQGCARMAFVGLSDSFERYHQAVRRCWRFGQQREVVAYVVTADAEGAVVRNIERKERQMTEMMAELVANVGRTGEHIARRSTAEQDEREGQDWRMLLGDCVERVAELEPESVGLSVFSPPFPSMYVYTDDPRDMGNVADVETMIEQFGYLVPELLRVLIPGRSVAIHLAQAQTRKRDGAEIGLRDFRGATINAMQRGGFTFYGEATIDKDPQVKAVRTKDRGLLFKSLAGDSSMMRMAQADYLLQFRKPGENPQPIRAGISEKYGNPDGWITPEEWIEWAAPVWYRAGDGYPGGIRETDTLNVAIAREGQDERHLCPLQLGVIERAVKLWSAPGDLVLSPFAGVGSEGVGALRFGRRFVGVELKRSYFETACANLEAAVSQRGQATLDLAGA